MRHLRICPVWDGWLVLHDELLTNLVIINIQLFFHALGEGEGLDHFLIWTLELGAWLARLRKIQEFLIPL